MGLRGLKFFAVLIVLLVIIAFLLVGYFFATASVSITAFGATGKQCADHVEEFNSIKAALEDETFIGTRFSFEPLKEAQDYALITYSVRLSNQCLVPIDMIEIQVVPDPTDILQLGQTKVYSLQPKSEGEFSATVMVPRESHSVRQLIVTYYVWGVSFDVKATYSTR